MIREEKRWITPAPVELPEFVGEVQEETTAGAVEGDLTLDGDERKKPPDTESPDTEPVEKPVEKPVERPADKPVADPVADPVAEPVAKPVEKPVDKPADKPVAEPVALPDIDPIWQPWGATQPQKPPSLIDKSKPVAPKVETPTSKSTPIADFFGRLSEAATGGKTGIEGSGETISRLFGGSETARKVGEGLAKAGQKLAEAEIGVLKQAGTMGLWGIFTGVSSVNKSPEIPKATQTPKGSGNVIDIKDYLKAVGK